MVPDEIEGWSSGRGADRDPIRGCRERKVRGPGGPELVADVPSRRRGDRRVIVGHRVRRADQPAPDRRRAAVRANIRASVKHLRHGSDIIEHLIQKAGLLVVGAEYSLQTGVVDFFDGMNGASATGP